MAITKFHEAHKIVEPVLKFFGLSDDWWEETEVGVLRDRLKSVYESLQKKSDIDKEKLKIGYDILNRLIGHLGGLYSSQPALQPLQHSLFENVSQQPSVPKVSTSSTLDSLLARYKSSASTSSVSSSISETFFNSNTAKGSTTNLSWRERELLIKWPKFTKRPEAHFWRIFGKLELNNSKVYDRISKLFDVGLLDVDLEDPEFLDKLSEVIAIDGRCFDRLIRCSKASRKEILMVLFALTIDQIKYVLKDIYAFVNIAESLGSWLKEFFSLSNNDDQDLLFGQIVSHNALTGEPVVSLMKLFEGNLELWLALPDPMKRKLFFWAEEFNRLFAVLGFSVEGFLRQLDENNEQGFELLLKPKWLVPFFEKEYIDLKAFLTLSEDCQVFLTRPESQKLLNDEKRLEALIFSGGTKEELDAAKFYCSLPPAPPRGAQEIMYKQAEYLEILAKKYLPLLCAKFDIPYFEEVCHITDNQYRAAFSFKIGLTPESKPLIHVLTESGFLFDAIEEGEVDIEHYCLRLKNLEKLGFMVQGGLFEKLSAIEKTLNTTAEETFTASMRPR